jgi:hypothetical protein
MQKLQPVEHSLSGVFWITCRDEIVYHQRIIRVEVSARKAEQPESLHVILEYIRVILFEFQFKFRRERRI